MCVCACSFLPESSIAEQVVKSGILPVLAQALRGKSALTVHTARLVAELSKDGEQRTSALHMCIFGMRFSRCKMKSLYFRQIS